MAAAVATNDQGVAGQLWGAVGLAAPNPEKEIDMSGDEWKPEGGWEEFEDMYRECVTYDDTPETRERVEETRRQLGL